MSATPYQAPVIARKVNLQVLLKRSLARTAGRELRGGEWAERGRTDDTMNCHPLTRRIASQLRRFLKARLYEIFVAGLERADVVSVGFEDVAANQRAAAGFAVGVNDFV